MIFHETGLSGAWLIKPERKVDPRGYFVRTFCAREFMSRGLETSFVQNSSSRSIAKGTIRGVHFQRAPHQEVKVVGCTRGAIYDVLVDLRPSSPTLGSWRGFELSDRNGYQLYIPKGFAHGFQTLADDAEISYMISDYYVPEAARGVRFDDAALSIKWPARPSVVSAADQSWPDLELSQLAIAFDK